MIKNKRLSFIVDLFDKNNNILLDIGTDHGYLIKDAFLKNKITKAIATDINEMPLLNAKNNLKNLNVKYYLTDGFKNITDDYDTVVIAGMGGNLISKILNDSPDDNNITYYLQPNNKEDNLRKYLEKNNFKIIDEFVLLENKYYVILKVVRGKMELKETDYLLGPILKDKSTSTKYYKHLKAYYKYIIDKNNLTKGIVVNKYNIINDFIKFKASKN